MRTLNSRTLDELKNKKYYQFELVDHHSCCDYCQQKDSNDIKVATNTRGSKYYDMKSVL